MRRPITWFAADAPEEFELERSPMFKRECAGELVLWGCGRSFGDETKLGLEARGGWIPPTIDPDVLDRSTSVEDWRALADLVSGTVPGVRPVPTRVAVCIGSLTPDGQFVLGRPGGDPRLVVAAGENSQGFKHATGIGEALADVVTDEPAKVSLAFADPDRFR